MFAHEVWRRRGNSIALALLGFAVLGGAAYGVMMLSRVAPKPPEPMPPPITNSIGMKLIKIPAGTFVMGSPEYEEERGKDEAQHRVKMSRPFFFGIYEVTQEQYEKVMGNNPSWFKPGGGGKNVLHEQDSRRHPVEDVTWQQAVEFCRRLSELAEEKNLARVYRLPTEAEWEYACRAGTRSPFHYGGEMDSNLAVMNGLSKYPLRGVRQGYHWRHTCEVGTCEPNWFGLFDMHGNVQEWCADWYGPYATDGLQEDPQGPEAGTHRVMRGGAWLSTGKSCRSAQRNKMPPGESHYGVGFRVVMEERQ